MIAPEHAAAAVVLLAALIGLLANPIARWFARADADLDRLVSDALDPKPDLEGNEAWWTAQGKSQLR